MADTRIVTVTLSPSLDRTLITHYLAVGYHNNTHEATRLDPAGQGVNIARALHRLKVEAHAIILLGDDAIGRAYEALVAAEGIRFSIIRVSGLTRSNTIILDVGNHTETQIIEEPSPIGSGDIDNVISNLKAMLKSGDIVVFAGGLPDGAPPETYATLTEVAHQAGAEAAVIAGGQPLISALDASPDLVGLTQVEAEGVFNYPVRVQEDVVGSARKLKEQGAGKALIAMSEANRAVLSSGDGDWIVDLPGVESGTSSGVWSALIAGFVAGRVTKHDDRESLRLGAAAATHTAGQIGSEFGSLNEIKDYIEDITVTAAEDA